MRSALPLALLSLLAFVSPVGAYSRSRNKQGVPTYWRNPCITLVSQGDTAPLYKKTPLLLGPLTAAAQAWTHDKESCSRVVFSVVASSETRKLVSRDGVNRVFYRTAGDCQAPGLKTCLPSETLAVTSVFSAPDGAILEADIEVNDIDPEWQNLDIEKPTRTAFDLQNALTHEIGHLLGFSHTCFLGGEPWPIDDEGNQVPSCDSISEDIAATTMVARINPGDLDRRSLADDDRRGLCDVYAYEGEDSICGGVQPVVVGRGCNMGGQGPGGLALVAAVVALGLLRRARPGSIRT